MSKPTPKPGVARRDRALARRLREEFKSEELPGMEIPTPGFLDYDLGVDLRVTLLNRQLDRERRADRIVRRRP